MIRPDDLPMFETICQWLDQQGGKYRSVEHEATLTSQASAEARGEPLKIGGKALLIKLDDTFRLFVLSADRKLDSSALKKHFGAKKSRFATAEELLALTGLVPGSVPPFGLPILPFPLFVDHSVLENDRIAFNAGSLTQSLVLSVADYQRVAQPTILSFSKAVVPPTL